MEEKSGWLSEIEDNNNGLELEGQQWAIDKNRCGIPETGINDRRNPVDFL